MFDQNNNDQNLPGNATPNLPQPPQIEDIFDATDKTGPIAPRPISAVPTPQMSPEELYGGRSISQNKLLLAGLIVVGILVLGGIGWWTFSFFSNYDFNQPAATGALNATSSNPVNTNTNSANNNAANVSNADTNSNVGSRDDSTDSDSDGLTDIEENRLDTDKRNFDSDSDGLTDGAEVNIYHSDPKNADTDGDSYKDGQEVISGYDPLKPGARLFNIPQ